MQPQMRLYGSRSYNWQVHFVLLFSSVIFNLPSWYFERGHVLSIFTGPLLALIVGVTVVSHWRVIESERCPEVLAWWKKRGLRCALVVLGFTISYPPFFENGLKTVFLAPLITLSVLGIGIGLGRILGVPFRRALLVTVGYAVCGATAAAGIAAILGAEEDYPESYAAFAIGSLLWVAISVALSIFVNVTGVVPIIGRLDLLGMILGGGIPEFAHVLIAAGFFDDEVVHLWASLVKGGKVGFYPVIWVIIAFSMRKDIIKGGKLRSQCPWYIFAFLGAILLATLAGDQEVYKILLPGLKWGFKLLLTVAIVALASEIAVRNLLRSGRVLTHSLLLAIITPVLVFVLARLLAT